MSRTVNTAAIVSTLTEAYRSLNPAKTSRAAAFGVIINTPSSRTGETLASAYPAEAVAITSEVLNALGFTDRVTCDLF